MIAFLARRVAAGVLVVLGVTVVTFVLLHVVASSPGRAILGPRASGEAVAQFDRVHGYDRSLAAQYWSYLGGLLHGDLGYSYRLGQPVTTLLGEDAGRSAYLAGASLVLALLVAVPLGLYQAARRDRPVDHALTAAGFAVYSMPSFFLGLVLIQLLALDAHVFPPEASQAGGIMGVVGDPRAMVLPVVTLAAVQVAVFSRYVRAAAIDALAQDYVRLARAQGLPERAVLGRHVLRNSSLSLLNLVGLSIPGLLAGNLVVETLFNYPGLGLLFYDSLHTGDYPVVLAYTLIAGTLTVAGNLLADVALSAADPRIRR